MSAETRFLWTVAGLGKGYGLQDEPPSPQILGNLMAEILEMEYMAE